LLVWRFQLEVSLGSKRSSSGAPPSSCAVCTSTLSHFRIFTHGILCPCRHASYMGTAMDYHDGGLDGLGSCQQSRIHISPHPKAYYLGRLDGRINRHGFRGGTAHARSHSTLVLSPCLDSRVGHSALAAGTLTKELAMQREQVEYRLSRGATWHEALHSVIRSSLTTALTPNINALLVTVFQA
jgi:hypothetical protein